MYSRKGNAIFMATIAIAAMLSTISIAVFGVSILTLAVVLLLTVSSIILGTWLEGLVEEHEKESSFYSQFEDDGQ